MGRFGVKQHVDKAVDEHREQRWSVCIKFAVSIKCGEFLTFS